MPSGRKPNVQRRRHVLRLRAQGLSLSEIAKRFNITKQAVWSLINHRPSLTATRSVPCSVCAKPILSPGALPRDRAAALCLDCLHQRPLTPFGQRLKALRLSAGLSPSELAKRAGLAPGSLRSYEEDERLPRRSTVGRLVRVLGGGLLGPNSPFVSRSSLYGEAS